jgi:hypothetical protein
MIDIGTIYDAYSVVAAADDNTPEIDRPSLSR